MGIATGEVSNDFPPSMVLDDQIFGMSIIAQHCLEARREILTADGVEDDARVMFHLLNWSLLDQEVMDRPKDGATRAIVKVRAPWVAGGDTRGVMLGGKG